MFHLQPTYNWLWLGILTVKMWDSVKILNIIWLIKMPLGPQTLELSPFSIVISLKSPLKLIFLNSGNALLDDFLDWHGIC